MIYAQSRFPIKYRCASCSLTLYNFWHLKFKFKFQIETYLCFLSTDTKPYTRCDLKLFWKISATRKEDKEHTCIPGAFLVFLDRHNFFFQFSLGEIIPICCIFYMAAVTCRSISWSYTLLFVINKIKTNFTQCSLNIAPLNTYSVLYRRALPQSTYTDIHRRRVSLFL